MFGRLCFFTLCLIALFSQGFAYLGRGCWCECEPWQFDAQALYMKPYAGGLEYAVTDVASVPNPASGSFIADNDYRLRAVDQETDWGVRIGGNRLLWCDCWSVGVFWTYFYAAGKSGPLDRVASRDSDAQGFEVNDIWSLYFPGDQPDQISGSLSTRYNTGDILLDRTVALSDCFCFDLILGVKSAFILERLRVVQNRAVVTGGANPPTVNFSEMVIKNDFRGAGPMVGVAPSWRILRNVSLDGQLQVAGLWGRYDLTQSQNLIIQQTGELTLTPLFNITAEREETAIQPYFNVGGNLTWKVFQSCFSVYAHVGYEVNYWLNYIRQKRISNFYGAATNVTDATVNDGKSVQDRSGDLVIHGLNFGLNVCF